MIEILIPFLIGLILGVLSMGLMACRSYDKGRKDAIKELPKNITNYLNDK